MTEYCRKLSGVTKSEISDARGVNETCQYPLRRSSIVTNFAEPTLSTQSSMRGIGQESGFVTLFTFLKYVQNRAVKSGLGTSRQG